MQDSVSSPLSTRRTVNKDDPGLRSLRRASARNDCSEGNNAAEVFVRFDDVSASSASQSTEGPFMNAALCRRPEASVMRLRSEKGFGSMS